MPNPEFGQSFEMQPMKEAPIKSEKSEVPQVEEPKSVKPESVVDKYSPEAIREQIKDQANLIRAWASETGLIEGQDFRVIESIGETVSEETSVAPHELKEFFVIFNEDKRRQFKDYFLGRYRDEMKQRDSKNEARLDYSWGGRFAVVDAGVFIDTVSATSIEKMTVPTHHEEFKEFFKVKAGFGFPTAETLNPQLQEMAEKGFSAYQEALTKLREMKESQTLPPDGYGLVDSMVHAVELLEKAKSGDAVQELPEVLEGTMPRSMRTYADLTYNAEDIANLDRVAEITGVTFPDEARIDKIFEHLGFDRKRMEEICKDFSEYIMIKKDVESIQ